MWVGGEGIGVGGKSGGLGEVVGDGGVSVGVAIRGEVDTCTRPYSLHRWRVFCLEIDLPW